MKKLLPRALCAAALLVGAVGGPAGAQAPADLHKAPTVSNMRTIIMKEYSFIVPTHVQAGARVRVVNEGSEGHTATGLHGEFDVGLPPGDTGYFTAPAEPGSYSFFCWNHFQMQATLVVKKRP